MRLILHAGFHKTGTTSVQQFLRANRAALRRHVRVFTRLGQEPLCEAARAFSVTRDAMDRALLAAEWGRFLAALDPGDPRPVLLSSEDLAGHMPGRHGLVRYDAAPLILTDLAALLPEGADLTVALSLRATGPWRRSCWAQHVRATRHVGGLDDYLAAAGGALADDAAAVARALGSGALAGGALAGRARVVTWALEQADGPFGPAGPLLDLLALPDRVRARLTPPVHANPSLPEAVLADLLALNRSGLERADWAAAKRAVIDAARGAR